MGEDAANRATDAEGERAQLSILTWTLTAFGTALVVSGGLGWQFLIARQWFSLYVLVIAIAAILTGISGGYALERLTRTRGLRLGAVLGYAALLPPAAQMGALLGSTLAAWAGDRWLGLAIYLICFVLGASALLCIGAGVGMAIHAALRAAWRRFFPHASFSIRPPRWRTVRIAVLCAFLGATVLYADRRVGLPWPEATPPAKSQWIEREKALFREVLSTGRYDVVVLPMAADGPTFDRIGRSLMTRYLALRAGERTGARLPDPTLLARALGVRERRIDLPEALRFAASVGAREVLESDVRRDGGAFTVRAKVWTREADGRWRERASAALEKLAFGDRRDSSAAFRDAADSLLERLKVGQARPAAPEAAGTPQTAPALEDLLSIASSAPASAVGAALRLQILASLHERDSLEAQALWERSLIALARISEATEETRVLEARAYLHLARRPYALERLGEPQSPAGRALRAVLDGNTPGAEKATDAIENRALRLLAEVELADLYDAFGLHTRLRLRRKQLLDPAWTEPAVLAMRLSAPDWFRPDVHQGIAGLLERVVPLGSLWRETAAAWLHRLYFQSDALGDQELRLARAIEQRHPAAWKASAAAWAAARAADRPAPWDYCDLLFAANRAAVFKTLASVVDKQGLQQQTANMAAALRGVYGGHPRLALIEAVALQKIGAPAPRGAQARLFSRASALAVAAYGWEGGESPVAAWLERSIFDRPFEKYLDEPPRWDRAEVPHERLHFERTSFTRREMEREIAGARRRLDFSDRHAQPLRDLVRWLRRSGSDAEAVAVVEQNQDRFVGAVARVELIAEARESSARPEDLLPFYRELVELDPDSWDARTRLARAYVAAGQGAKAQQTWLEYPGFASQEDRNVVGLSNQAFEAGYYLYRHGESELALPLFVQSSRLQTWSSREIHSRELLALAENNLAAALDNARYQVERYNSSAGAMRYLLYELMLGRKKQMLADFPVLADRFGDHGVWTAAFVAQRMEGMDERQLEAWLQGLARSDTRRDYLTNALRERHAFMMALTDRPASDEALALVRRVTQANNRVDYYPELAEGYLAFRRGDYALAAKKMRGAHNTLFNLSINRRESLNEWLPYLAYAYLRSGQEGEASKIVAAHLSNIGRDSDYLVATALLDGAAGRHDAATTSLRLAFYRLASTSTRSLHTGYVLLEACEILYRDSGQDAYRALIEDFAHRLQVDVPYSWAAAFEAKYARELDAKHLAIAAASILDPKSERIAAFSESERAAVRSAAIRHGSLLGVSLRAKSR